jgi:hypothetical protein
MFPSNPRTLDSFWPRRNESRLPYAPNRTPNWVTPWITPGEQVRYEVDCASGKPNRYGPDDIEYRYNSQGFRCIEFGEIPEGSFVVLSLGDSNAEGIGVPVEHTWPHLLCEKLRPLVDSQVCDLNLGLAASSNQHIAIRSCRAMQSPELHPDIVFIDWSYSHRILYVYEDGELMDWPFPTHLDMKSKDPKVKLRKLYYEQLQSEKFDLSNLMANIMMVEAVAEPRGIRICHSFIHQSTEKQDWLSKRVDGIYGSPQEARTARDLIHYGLDHNDWISTRMLDWFKSAQQPAKNEMAQ